MNEEPCHPGEEPAANHRGQSSQAWDDLGRAVRGLFEAGAADARRLAREAVPRSREEAARGLQDLAYGAGWLLHFGAELARQAAPERMADGWARGSAAGRQAAERWRGQPKSDPGTSNETEAPAA